MRKIINISLNSKDINNAIKEINNWSSEIKRAAQKSIEDLAKLGKQEAENNYNSKPYQASTGMNFGINNEGLNRKEVYMSGPQAIYEEFGTGTEGENNPHPEKDGKGLNDYNSGPTIRPAKKALYTTRDHKKIGEGELYWTYVDESGKVIYTQGIPAGKEMYDSMKTVVKKAPQIIEEEIEGVFK